MRLYVLALFPNSTVTADDVAEAFPEAHYELAPTVWIVASASLTASDVAKRVGIGPTEDRRQTGVVFKASTAYSGFGPRTLWDRLSAWEESE